MSLPANEQKAFEKLADTLNTKITPKLGEIISKFLGAQGVDKQVKPFFVTCLEEIGTKGSTWRIPSEKILKILQFIPDNWKDTVVTDDLLLNRIPEKDWNKFRDGGWIKEHSKSEAATAAPEDFKVSIVRERDDVQQGQIAYEITVEADFSDLAKKLEGTPEEDVEEAIEDAFQDGTLIKELDHPIWDHLRHKYDNLAGSGIEIEEKPRTLKDLTANTKFIFKVVVSYDPPNIDEQELANKFKEAFRGVV